MTSEVNAIEILERIKRHEPTIIYENTVIKDNLNISELALNQTGHIDRSDVDGYGMGLSETVKQVVSEITCERSPP